jgi:predicted component of type VI protein secretion system
MDLILKVVEGPSSADWRGLEARFDSSGGLIGRAETARLSLPDSSRTVSRFHAHISCSGDSFFLEEMGSRNAASVNGKALKAGTKEALRPGDKVRIGHFTLAVYFDDPDFPATQIIDRRSLQMARDEDEGSTLAVREATGSRGASSSNELLEAFQIGAGIDLEMPIGLRPEFMMTLGKLLRTLVGGLHYLSSQRMRLRDEPSDRNSNPLARHIDPIRAAAEETRLLATLLKPGAIGSDKPQARVQETIEDLAARIAAMRAAVDATLEQAEAKFSPAAMEARLERSLVLDELLPMRRKARLWDLYRRTHGSAAAAPTNGGAPDTAAAAPGRLKANRTPGVRELFNQAFTRVYEQEVARLRRER